MELSLPYRTPSNHGSRRNAWLFRPSKMSQAQQTHLPRHCSLPLSTSLAPTLLRPKAMPTLFQPAVPPSESCLVIAVAPWLGDVASPRSSPNTIRHWTSAPRSRWVSTPVVRLPHCPTVLLSLNPTRRVRLTPSRRMTTVLRSSLHTTSR